MPGPEVGRRALLRGIAGGAAALGALALARQPGLAQTRPLYQCDVVHPKYEPQHPFTQVELHWVRTIFPDQAEALARSAQPDITEGINYFGQKIKEYQESKLPITYRSIIEDRPVILPYPMEDYRQARRQVAPDAISVMMGQRRALGYQGDKTLRPYFFPYFANPDVGLGSFNPEPGIGSSQEANLSIPITQFPWHYLRANMLSQAWNDLVHEALRQFGGQTNQNPASILHIPVIENGLLPEDVEGICINNAVATPSNRVHIPAMYRKSPA